MPLTPHVNFMRMTARLPAARQASQEQKQQLQSEFKTLPVRTYSGRAGQGPDPDRQAAARQPWRY